MARPHDVSEYLHHQEFFPEEVIEEADETLRFYLGQARQLSEYRNELLQRDPEGEYYITPWFLKRYLERADWLGRAGIQRSEVTYDNPIRSTNAEVERLLECQIITEIDEGNSEMEDVVSVAEEGLIKAMLDEWWPDDQIQAFAACDRDQWDGLNKEQKWRRVAQLSQDQEYVKGRPNFFRYHAPLADEEPQIRRPAGEPFIDLLSFLEASAVRMPEAEPEANDTTLNIALQGLTAVKRRIIAARQRIGTVDLLAGFTAPAPSNFQE